MSAPDQPPARKPLSRWSLPLRTALIYAVLGVLWIVLTDYLAMRLTADVEVLNFLQTFKGWFFVAMTAALLYGLIRHDLEQLRRSEDSLLAAEDRYRQMFEHSQSVMLVIDPQTGAILDANEAASAFYGWSHAELTARTIFEINTLPRETVARALADAGSGQRRHFNFRHRLASGEIRDVEVHTGPLMLAGRRVLLSVIHDVTDRIRAEVLLAGALEQASTLYEISHALITAPTLEEQLRAFAAPSIQRGPCNVSLFYADRDEEGRLEYAELRAHVRAAGEPVIPVGTRFRFADFAAGRIVDLDTAAVMTVPDTEVPSEYLDMPMLDLLRQGGYRAIAFIPLTPVGRAGVGFVIITWPEPYDLSTEERQIYTLLAPQFAALIENQRLLAQTEKLYEAEREQRALAEALRESAAAVSSTLELDEVLDHILASIRAVIPYDIANILMIEGDMAYTARRRDNRNEAPATPLPAWRLPLAEASNLRWMAENHRPLVLPDLLAVPDWIWMPGSEWHRSYVGAPILIEGEVIGFLGLLSGTPGFFTAAHAERLQMFAGQAAVAIRNARLYESERRQLRLARTLQEVGTLLTAQMSLSDVIERLFDLLAVVVQYDSIAIQLLDEAGHLTESYARGFPDARVVRRVANRVLQQTIQERWSTHDVLVIPDTHADSRWIRNRQTRHIRAWVGAALRVRGRLIGVLNVDSKTPGMYSEEVAGTVVAFASQAAVAIENARLYSESRMRNRRLEALNAITRIGAETLDLDEMLRRIANAAPEIIGGDGCYISLWDAECGVPIPSAASGDLHEPFRQKVVYPGEHTLTEAALRQGAPLVVEDLHTTPYTSDSIKERVTSTMPGHSALVLPLQADGRDIGAILLKFDSPHEFTQDEITWGQQAAELIALAIAKAQAYSELEQRVQRRTAELRAANERLIELSRLKDEFVSNVSHELRTPVASIKLYHHLLAARPEKQAAYLEHLNRETLRLEGIIEDLLYLTRLDQRQIVLDMAPLDLNELAGLYVLDRALLAERRGLTLRFEGADHLPRVLADQESLEQALSTLLTNAINYTPPGGSITLSTALREKDGSQWVTLSVSDTGPGIPPDEMPYIFERFFRGRVGRNSGSPGTGLGLPIALAIVEQHGGRIEAHSSGVPGEGACFTIWLPAIPPEQSSHPDE